MSIHKKRPKLNAYFKAKVLLKGRKKKLKLADPASPATPILSGKAGLGTVKDPK
jgi:hypothetical protein